MTSKLQNALQEIGAERAVMTKNNSIIYKLKDKGADYNIKISSVKDNFTMTAFYELLDINIEAFRESIEEILERANALSEDCYYFMNSEATPTTINCRLNMWIDCKPSAARLEELLNALASRLEDIRVRIENEIRKGTK